MAGNTVFSVATDRSSSLEVYSKGVLLYGTETSRDSHAREASEYARDVPDDTDAGNTYVYPSTFGRRYIFPLVSAHARQLRGTWVVDFD